MRSHTPISGTNSLLNAYTTPRQPTGVHQADSSTYQGSSITLNWTAPVDTGCIAISYYKIEALIADVWTEVLASTSSTTGTADLSAQIG